MVVVNINKVHREKVDVGGCACRDQTSLPGSHASITYRTLAVNGQHYVAHSCKEVTRCVYLIIIVPLMSWS